jgi:hypothetical protein
VDAAAKPGRGGERKLVRASHPQRIRRFVKTESPEVLVAKTHTCSTHPGGKKEELKNKPQRIRTRCKDPTRSRQGDKTQAKDRSPIASSDEEPEKGMDDEDPGGALYPLGMPKDIQREVHEHILESQPVPVHSKTVRFEDNPVVIPLP